MIISRTRFMEEVSREYASLLKKLPPDVSEQAGNIAFIIEDRPSGDANDDTLGLYEGIPLAESTVTDLTIPGRIIIYRIPLMESCTGIRDLRKEIRITILHELGHHLGFDEDELAERGLD